MTEEIKEILEFLEDDNRERPFGISKYDLKVLKDYITNLQQENDSLKKQINERKKLDRMRFNMVMSHYGIVKESEEMKTIEWLNKKRFDTSLTGIELNYLNILYYLILNVLEVNNEK